MLLAKLCAVVVVERWMRTVSIMVIVGNDVIDLNTAPTREIGR